MNVGDRVRIDNDSSNWHGRTGLVVEDRGGHPQYGLPYRVEFGDDNGLTPFFGISELVLIEAARKSTAPNADRIEKLENAVETLKVCVLYLLMREGGTSNGC